MVFVIVIAFPNVRALDDDDDDNNNGESSVFVIVGRCWTRLLYLAARRRRQPPYRPVAVSGRGFDVLRVPMGRWRTRPVGSATRVGGLRPLPAALLLAALPLTGCDEPIDGYLPAASMANAGFAREQARAIDDRGRVVRLWGFVDHGNLYGDFCARRILREWWAGDGPNADTWRFNLKVAATDAVGRSFAVLVPNDAGRADLLGRLVADARAGRPTKVFVSGRLFCFDAPTQAADLTGLSLELASSRDIRLAPLPGSF